MTKSQAQLLKRCIRAALTAEKADDWLVEVGRINGVSPKTAASLVEAGLLRTDVPEWQDINTNTHVRLPRRDELKDPLKSWDDWLN